jgi:polyhydroxyalkanoate synthase subunit PhaC
MATRHFVEAAGAPSRMTSQPDSPEDRLRELAASTQSLIEQLLGDLPRHGLEPATVLRALTATPESRAKLSALQTHYYREWLNLLTDKPPAPADADRRFDAPEWRELPWFRMLRRGYELNAEYLAGIAEIAEVEPVAKRRLRYVTRQLADALAPTNFAATNPEAIRRALETRGDSVKRGLELLSGDIARGQISMSDESAFEIGRNLAATPGDVVYENDVMQLIQYTASTREVHERPLLIVPPFINKYYILDLQADNSLARHCVAQGYTTFMVSWRNIPETLGHLTWEDYIDQGVLEPVNVVREITGSLTVNTLGFCVGGTLLATALAVLAARKRKPVHSLTLLASMLDFSDTGDISVYIDPEFVERTEAQYGKTGVIPGSRLAATFAMLRANDLVWHYVVNNYLLGRKPRAFDLLYWNADGSNLPGPLYAFYLRHMYLENNLRVPGKLRLKGVPIDLGAISLPAYVVATREDHIVPWKTAFSSAQLLGGRTDFVLGASGHVAGIVNPASHNRRQHWIGGPPVGDPEHWLASAQQVPGSWWTSWCRWLSEHSGGMKAAPRTGGSDRYPPIEPAPGRYVRNRIEAVTAAAGNNQ